ncbi:DUF4350 domain-containing protein [Stenomitos frigidus]|uniref:DUF4350 domain-containing protein n=1 Tax=Stenomitos frigidus ULC18 TaxID=2107698 RepID=A0A2T1ED51_9CYAN|nr:DUF4350 domain-containing protein [Stenomitos frigidus]PSB30682.1 DUF4350 domain-containing protein [Stenomitos frigidus ULC18]
MSLSKRQIWLLSIALATLVILSLFAAPGNRLQSGSTYGRAPHGYGAWYALMESRGLTIHRWQKPLQSLFQPSEPKTPAIETLAPGASTAGISAAAFSATAAAPTDPITLLQISNGEPLSVASMSWVERGNVLVLLGVNTPVTKAPFDSTIANPVGEIRIQTSRRGVDRDAKTKPLLNDSFGSIVWRQAVGKGQIIFASTPNLAANAYQNAQGNYEFLARLVTTPNLPIWVDEYSHGYKDSDVIQQETSGSLLGYLAKTPVLLVVLQTIVILLVLIWGQNRRLGPAIALPTPSTDNSKAYIQALSAVLRKAESSQFVVTTVCKAEQLEVQKALGLGTEPLPLATLLDAWTQQTGQPAAILEAALHPAIHSRRIGESDLLKWLQEIKTIRQQLGRKG